MWGFPSSTGGGLLPQPNEVVFNKKVVMQKVGNLKATTLDLEGQIFAGSENSPGRLFLVKNKNLEDSSKAVIALSAEGGGRFHIKDGNDRVLVEIQEGYSFVAEPWGCRRYSGRPWRSGAWKYA